MGLFSPDPTSVVTCWVRRTPLLDRVVAEIRDVDIALSIHRHCQRKIEAGRNQRSQLLRRRAPLLNRVVVSVRDIDIALAVHGNSVRRVQPRGYQSGHLLGGGDPLPNGVVAGVGDIEIAAAVDRHARTADSTPAISAWSDYTERHKAATGLRDGESLARDRQRASLCCAIGVGIVAELNQGAARPADA